MQVQINLLPKQSEAFEYWEDTITTELGYGGAAGGGKTRLGCYIAIITAEKYPKSRGAIGRKELKNLRLTTLATLFEIFGELNYTENDYKYDAQQSIITFTNGSQIYLLDTAYSPQDPDYTRFGGLELTWAWIDESNETPDKAISILKTRVGRKNNINGIEIKPFWLETFNPNKGHVYRDYYKPFKDEILPEYRRFIRALPGDNPHLPQSYIQNLERSDKITRERLLKGNFEFDDNPQKIIKYDAISDLSFNTIKEEPTKFIIADIARFGGDKIVISTWRGMTLYSLGVYTYQGIDETIRKIKDQAFKEHVLWGNILVDEDGVGGGVVDGMRGIKGFSGNSSPLQVWDYIKGKFTQANYQNFRSQCYFRLSEIVNNREIALKVTQFETNIDGYTVEKAIAEITEELDVIQMKPNSEDGKLAIIPKSEIKEVLGRSPDFADVFMMRMFYELKEISQTFKPIVFNKNKDNPAI